jgi:hypothetical protein
MQGRADCIHLENTNLDIIKELITQPVTELTENYRTGKTIFFKDTT